MAGCALSEAEGPGEQVKLIDVNDVGVRVVPRVLVMAGLEFSDVSVDTCSERRRNATSAHADAGGLGRFDANEG